MTITNDDFHTQKLREKCGLQLNFIKQEKTCILAESTILVVDIERMFNDGFPCANRKYITL